MCNVYKNMNLSIKNSIYQGIISKKWINISYVNSRNEKTNFYIGVIDIDINKEIITCDIFNPFKSNETLAKDKGVALRMNNIKSASVLEHTYYETSEMLLSKIKHGNKLNEYLEVVNFDNNILKYLSDAYRLDNDPFLKEVITIDGIDLHTLSQKGAYKLDDNQFDILLRKIFKVPVFEAEKMNRFRTLAINSFSIDLFDKEYVVAYKILTLNFKNKTLRCSDKSYINKSFLISEDKKVTLGSYLDMNQDVFASTFDEKKDEYIELIKGNFHHGEIVNTRPSIFFLERNSSSATEEALDAIYKMDECDTLTYPLKSFFGRNKCRNNVAKEADIVVFDKNKINIDQLRVVSNSMTNHVTYVKGPPGTGKTETIFNVLLSAYSNNKKVLVTSNNNHPVDDIYSKMSSSFNNVKKYIHDDFMFPMLRIENYNDTKNTIIYLKTVLEYIKNRKQKMANMNLTEGSKNKSLSAFYELKKYIKEYEEMLNLKERRDNLLKIKEFAEIPKVTNKINEQIELEERRIKEKEKLEEIDILDYVSSMNENINFINYLYYSSLNRFKKLLGHNFDELKDIIEKDDVEEAIKEFNRFIKDNDNLNKLLTIFPIIVTTNLSSHKLGDPSPHFDLCVMDESGQCNIATSLIPMVRCKDLLLVGDTNQLQPVTVIEENVNNDLLKKYGVKEEYNYVKNSILSTMLRKDNNSKSILLSYHYRCANKIANFVNERFYEKQLKLLNKNEGNLLYVDTKNVYNPNYKNCYIEEAKEIVNIIKNNGYKDVGIITPFVNQAHLINLLLKRNGIEDIKAGTIHTLQGSEKSVIIMSAALSIKTSKRTMDWIKNNHELINVGVTRAKERFILVGDKEAIDVLSKGETNDIKVLSDYVYANGLITVPKSDSALSVDFSNNSKNEKEFFATVKPYFNRRGSKFKIERNVPVSKAIKNIIEDDLRFIGKKEFDLVVQTSGGFFNKNYRTIIAFEIDGGEHVGDSKTIKRDREKEIVCSKYGIKMIRIANSQVKDYEAIIALFECVIKDLRTLDEATVQMSLFEDESVQLNA